MINRDYDKFDIFENLQYDLRINEEVNKATRSNIIINIHQIMDIIHI